MSSIHPGAATNTVVASLARPAASGGAPVNPGAGAPELSGAEPEPPPRVARALAAAAESEGAERAASWELCTALLAAATGWLAWTLPAPSARDVLLVALCLALVAIERRRAGAHFRKAIADAAGAGGATEGEAARAAWRLDAAFCAARAAGRAAVGARRR
ncbi:hypothetical protein [Sorangium sp. So ce1000]|uniref:hypothetical protein n=1 Tax=Sorangium sp. So ce1000 TaxID=3133325 RepID=UPI003F5D67F0